MKWRINYYITENAFKAGIPAFYETINGDRNFVISWAQNKIKHSQFRFFDRQQL